MNLLDVRPALDGSLWWRNARLADRLQPPAAVQAGQGALLGLRPEQLSLPGSRWAPHQQQTVASLTARLATVEAAGDHQIIWLDAEVERLAVRAEPEWQAVIGEQVPVTLHLDHACWFSAEGEGLRL